MPGPIGRTARVQLSAEERRREIVQLLEKHGRVTVNALKDRFGVSAVTARSDLDALSASGALVRSHGGGIRPLTVGPDHSLRNRESIHQEEKARIAHAAAALLKPHDTVILCSGTTSEGVARELRRSAPEYLTVITYALNIAVQLADLPHISVVMVGGILRQVSSAFVGPHAEQMMRSLHADHCFLGTVGLDLDVGLTTLDIMEAQLNQVMIRAARQVTVLADSSKFGERSLAVISDFSNVKRLITDSGAPPEAVVKLRNKGIDVVLA
ncbi:MAG: DeoR/GlpR family DNA-binding transcription regulator [Bryobacteraceae bacterium]